MVLRQEVFVVEQNCPYLDADGKDQKGWHILGYQGEKLVAYARILPQGTYYADAVAIGRVLAAQEVRRQGIGIDLMQVTLEWANRLFPSQRIRISAQTYLIKFYENIGFHTVGEEYDEDGIPHIQMVIEPKSWE